MTLQRVDGRSLWVVCLLLMALLAVAWGGRADNETDKKSVTKASMSAPSTGRGSSGGRASCPEEDPCVITTVEQLQAIGRGNESRRGHYVLGSDIDASVTEGWNDGAGFNPISRLEGSLDGRGHAIIGLYINRPDDTNIGMFSCIGDGAEVRNVSLVEAKVAGNAAVGIVVGTSKGFVHNVKVDGEVNGTDSFAGSVGGLAGVLASPGTVSQSYTTGIVRGEGERIGGLIGCNGGAVISSFSTS